MKLNKLPFALCLVAAFSACVVDDGDTDTDAATGDTDPTNPSTTVDPSSSTDPSTTIDPSTTVDPSSSTDPSTTEPGTSETSETDTDAGTTVADTTGTDTDAAGACGWDAASMFYSCGFEGEDPDGNFPLECPVEPVAGDPCTKDGEINGIGCCYMGANAYCLEDGTIAIETCE
jgi:hypothetical protein